MDLSSLSAGLRAIAYPAGMTCVEPNILGQGFYPGARGFAAGKSPAGGIMLLGRDFGTSDYYESLAGIPPRDEYALTWRHTREIWLSASQPSLGDLPVWCTNYLMGLRNDGSAKGNIKRRISHEDWSAFERSCWAFLQQQVILQQPRVIVVFGDDNKNDLMNPNRLGSNLVHEIRHTFQAGSRSHTAEVVFASHPHSLIPHSAKLAAVREVERIRALYTSLSQPRSS